MKRVMVAALLALGPMAPVPLAAQENGSVFGIAYLVLGVGTAVRMLESSVTLRAGDEIRVQRWRAADVRGQLVRVSSDSVFVRVADSLAGVPRSDIRRIQRFDGVERKWAQGYTIGLGLGVVMAAAGYASGDDSGTDLNLSAGEKAVILGLVGAISGSATGALIGVFKRGDHWRSTHDLPLTMAVAPGRSGMRVGLRLGF
jgi:hypothetical protein